MVIHLDELDLARDRDLVERYQAGDERAFDSLFERYFPPLRQHCQKKVGDPGTAEEIAQEAFVKALRALPGFAGERRFFPWLLVIANRLCIDHHRRAARVTPKAEVDPGVVIDIQDSVVARVDAEQLHVALARIRGRHRQVLKLRDWDGLSYAEIATRLEVPEPTVNALLFRARAALRREYLAVSGARIPALVPFFFLVRSARSLRQRAGSWLSQNFPDPSALATPLAAATVGIAAIVAPAPISLQEVTSPAPPRIQSFAPAAHVEIAPVPAELPEPATAEQAAPEPAAVPPAPPAPVIEAGAADVYLGPEGTERSRDEARRHPLSFATGPAFFGFDADQAAEDFYDGITRPLN